MDPPPPHMLHPFSTADPPPPPPPQPQLPLTHNHISAPPPQPPPQIPQSFSHPPYSEMIFAAITALKERDGSSKRAIAKYIERVYTGLPPSHPSLLTHHLKRLKNTGGLIMVKKSYKLPGPGSDLAFNKNNSNTSTLTSATTSTNTTSAQHSQSSRLPVSSTSPTPGAKRGRGRPPKPKPTFENGQSQQQFAVNSSPIYSAQPITTFRSITQPPQPPAQQPFPNPFAGFQSISQNIAATQQSGSVSDAGGTQPVLVALGLAEDPNKELKKRPGRPKKVLVGQIGQVVVNKKGRGRPPKKSPGRPKKPKSVASLGTNVLKKRPGRPPKSQPGAQVVAPASYPPGTTVIAVPRPRGRPKKVVGASDATNVMLVPRRPGRPPKVDGVVTPRKRIGRPVGRPKKSASASWTTQQAKAFGDLKSKLDFFQSRVKHAVGLLRTTAQVTSETTNGEVEAAMFELEGLASMDINIPFREERSQPPLPATTVPES